MRFPIYDDYESDIELKYKIGGDVATMPQIENFTFVFAFDYLSLAQTYLCFDNPDIKTKDFIELFKLKKRLSTTTVKQIQEQSKQHSHFHYIDLNQKGFLFEPLKKLFNYSRNIDPSKFPSLYQIAIYTDSELEKAPRIIGFFGKYGVFHVLWLDYKHKIYPQKR